MYARIPVPLDGSTPSLWGGDTEQMLRRAPRAGASLAVSSVGVQA
jgi:hypothetical protein